MEPSLPHSLRRLAVRSTGKDAELLWRAARQLELLYESVELSTETATDRIGTDLAEARRLGERRLLLSILYQTNGSPTRAAARLKISRHAIYKALKRHGMKDVTCH